ncbi:MAG: hypothetical protein ACJAVR_001502 [Paracoccaceae bacterium]|jgi:hypothetical protein
MGEVDDGVRAVRAHERHLDVWRLLNAATVDSGAAAVKSLFIMNGGAVVALLAFVANAVGECGADLTGRASSALLLFSYGLISAAAVACGAYLVNFCYLSSVAAARLTWSHPFTEKSRSSRNWLRIGRPLHALSIIVAIASLSFFLFGVWDISTLFNPAWKC